ncbi:MAG TPA: radical SAM family heme chaperone HemW [Candidatus Polarisedimenticolaceae bacterium]|nr:radical SAM family heme chaperone HemW [Candidatus Polarisedimenticolaceae bacterium]
MTLSAEVPAPGVYVHVPFCAIRCSYCDFPTVAGQDARLPAYLDALEREIERFQRDVDGPVDTIYLGGGTPSRLSPGQLGRVLDAVRARFPVTSDAEVTLEGNPESLGEDALAGFADAGVTRFSVGVQSLDDGVLRRVGRAHDAAEAEEAVARALATGRQVNADLIAGLPGEDLARWDETIARVASWGTDHVSVYLLETDKDTPLARAVRGGRAEVADDDRQAEAYATTVQGLEAAGLAAYEISNFARPGRQSRHNLKYWTDAPYAAFGLGAHAYAAGRRRANTRDLSAYLAALADGRDPVEWWEPFQAERRLGEALMLGLRLACGVDLDALGRRYALDPRRLYGDAWARAQDAGLVAFEGSRVWMTPEGRLRSNELFVAFV